MLNFKVKKLDNIKFSKEELISYYNLVNEKYQHLKWTPATDKSVDTLTHSVDNMYSWAIQSNLLDPTTPCPPYHVKFDQETCVENDFSVPTELIFGFAKTIITAFPKVRQTVISAHPPGSRIDLHSDNDEFLKIHIPIETNSDAWFFFEGEKFNLEVGSAYMINTVVPHGTDNLGTTDRIHLIFKIHKDDIDTILNNEWLLSPSLIDFDILELPNFKFNLDELQSYYNIVSKDYGYLKWIMPPKDPTVDPARYPSNFEKSIGIFGYAILTNLDDVNIPVPAPGDFKKVGNKKPFDKKTPMVLGFADKILEQFPDAEELVITGHPINTSLHPHVDKDEHVRIHLPIISTPESYFLFGDKKYVLEVGKAYIVNTKRNHATDNQGTLDRVHLHFKVHISRILQIIQTRYTI